MRLGAWASIRLHSSEGRRSCFFTIGVPPPGFDSITSDLKHIGISSFD